MEADFEKLDNNEKLTRAQLRIAAYGVEKSLKGGEIQEGSNYSRGCQKHKIQGPENAVVGIKISKNELWTFYFALAYEANGTYSQYAYVGYVKTEYGAHSLEYLAKIKKTRLYPKNNIYTEEIKFSNGIIFVIEDFRFVRHIVIPDTFEFNVQQYYYTDCYKNN